MAEIFLLSLRQLLSRWRVLVICFWLPFRHCSSY